MRQRVTIIGYSLDAILEAVRRSTEPNVEVSLLYTATPGSPLDTYGDCVTNRYMEVISELIGKDIACDEYINPRYLYLPFNVVKITNRRNGVIQFPLSSKSFDSDEEWKECAKCMSDKAIIDSMSDMSLQPTKIFTAMKNVMPSKFVDTFIRAMGATRWRGVQIAKLSMQGYRYEFPLDFIGKSDYNEYFCRPRMTYRSICETIMKRFGINYRNITTQEAAGIVKDNKYLGHVVIMDNRVDQFVDYIGGRFDRQRFYTVNMKVPPELEFAGDGLFYTPLSACWAVSIFNGKAKRFMSEVVESLYDEEITEIPSTRTNIKLYDTYVNLIRQFGDKELMLGQKVETLIK
jgi:hypothetical protein